MNVRIWKSESGEEHTIKEWINITGIPRNYMYKYHKLGITVEQAVERYNLLPNHRPGAKGPTKYKDGYLYTYCTGDEYELPLVVADSIDELSQLSGLKKTSIYPMLSRGDGRIHRIKIDEDDY